jgi:hypothetical protein
MKVFRRKSIGSFLFCVLALSTLPLLQGCDDGTSDDPNAKNAWLPAEFQVIVVGTANSSSGGGSGG